MKHLRVGGPRSVSQLLTNHIALHITDIIKRPIVVKFRERFRRLACLSDYLFYNDHAIHKCVYNRQAKLWKIITRMHWAFRTVKTQATVNRLISYSYFQRQLHLTLNVKKKKKKRLSASLRYIGWTFFLFFFFWCIMTIKKEKKFLKKICCKLIFVLLKSICCSFFCICVDNAITCYA